MVFLNVLHPQQMLDSGSIFIAQLAIFKYK